MKAVVFLQTEKDAGLLEVRPLAAALPKGARVLGTFTVGHAKTDQDFAQRKADLAEMNESLLKASESYPFTSKTDFTGKTNVTSATHDFEARHSLYKQALLDIANVVAYINLASQNLKFLKLTSDYYSAVVDGFIDISLVNYLAPHNKAVLGYHPTKKFVLVESGQPYTGGLGYSGHLLGLTNQKKPSEPYEYEQAAEVATALHKVSPRRFDRVPYKA